MFQPSTLSMKKKTFLKDINLMSVLLAGIFTFITMTSNLANAYITAKEHYYGANFQSKIQSGQLKNQELLDYLFKVLKSVHVKQNGSADIITDNCPSKSVMGSNASVCLSHNSLGYDRARLLMFGKIDLRQDTDGTYFVKDVYCEKNFSDKDFNSVGNIGPNKLPISGSIINTEHTWPQSRFTGRFDKNMQKSDLHHLFPSESEMNSRRSSLRFGNVIKDVEKLKCPISHLGKQQNDNTFVFEPPTHHKGNVARALFYFATRYQMKLSPFEEATLRVWNKEDPVDEEEINRNNMIEDLQGNRNPYVDYPELMDQLDTVSFKANYKPNN